LFWILFLRYQAKRSAEKKFSEMTYNLNSVSQFDVQIADAVVVYCDVRGGQEA